MTRKTQSLILGLMCLVLTIAICVQVKTVETNGTTIGMSENENQLRDQVLKMKEKYENTYQNLERAEKELEEERQRVSSSNEELKKLEEQIKKANTLLGFTDVKGPGVTITLTDGIATTNTLDPSALLVHDVDVLSVVNELRNAGAEAIEVNGKRIVSTSAIMCDGNVITVNGEKVSSTFTINAIGLPELLATLNRPGGYLPRLEDYLVSTTFKKMNNVTINKYTGGITFKYAKTQS